MNVDNPKHKALQQIRSEAVKLEEILTTSLDSPVLREGSAATPEQKLSAIANGLRGLRDANRKLTSLTDRLIGVTDPEKLFDNVPWMIAIGSIGGFVLIWMRLQMVG